jgi:hypothetical protein
VFAILVGSSFPVPALAQSDPIEASRPYAPFTALNLDGGLAMQSAGTRLRWLGAAAAGLGFFNGSHVWEATAGLRDVFAGRRELTFALARLGIQNGIGFHAEGLWSFTSSAPGAGAGLSFSLLNVEGAVLFDSDRTRCLLFFLRLPVGLFIEAGRSHGP